MLTTREVLDLVRAEFPGSHLTEAQIRYALRNGAIRSPRRAGGRFLWSKRDVTALTKVLVNRDASRPTSTSESGS